MGTRVLHRLPQRPSNYLEHFWALVNWEFVAKNLAA
ncbi:hypothetical protein SEEK5349_06500 [Salmonella enterica subsp. enterica serovar Kentucky str. 5349]|nr:hypothetical protein SEEK5349_06500 [Salmonella enterica subsp. enterica serovar Kentucky str. 5349]